MKPFIFPGLILITVPLTLLISDMSHHKDYYREKYLEEKANFFVAIQALQQGKTIHRNIKYPTYYIRMEMVFEGKKTISYLTRGLGDQLHQHMSFKIEDVLAEDWIIEE